GAGFESEIILIAAIKINFQSRQICAVRESERAVAIPKCWVGRGAKSLAQYASTDAAAGIGRGERGDLIDQSGTVRADCGKKLWMAKRKVQCAVTAHRDSADAAIGAAR